MLRPAHFKCVRAWEIEIHLSGSQVSALAAQRRNFSIYLLNLRRIPIDLSSLLVSVIAARPRSGEKTTIYPVNWKDFDLSSLQLKGWSELVSAISIYLLRISIYRLRNLLRIPIFRLKISIYLLGISIYPLRIPIYSFKNLTF